MSYTSNLMKMYKVLILLQVFYTFFSTHERVLTGFQVEQTSQINWLEWEEAIDLHEKAPKKIFVDVYTEWCGYCKKMDKTTFADPKIVNYINTHFYAIKLDAEMKEMIQFRGFEFEWRAQGRKGIHMLAYTLCEGKLSFPTYVTLTENYDRIAISPGYKTSPMLYKELVFAAEEKYKEMSWKEFVESY